MYPLGHKVRDLIQFCNVEGHSGRSVPAMLMNKILQIFLSPANQDNFRAFHYITRGKRFSDTTRDPNDENSFVGKGHVIEPVVAFSHGGR